MGMGSMEEKVVLVAALRIFFLALLLEELVIGVSDLQSLGPVCPGWQISPPSSCLLAVVGDNGLGDGGGLMLVLAEGMVGVRR